MRVRSGDAAAAGVRHRLGGCPQRQALHPEAAQVRAGRGALRPHREEAKNSCATGAAWCLPPVLPARNEANPAHVVVRPAELPATVGQDRAPVRGLTSACVSVEIRTQK